jgi:hypothetical protein
MDPLKVAAQFAAIRWFVDHHPNEPGREEKAICFSRENWVAFLPQATEETGTVLLRLAAYCNQVLGSGRECPPAGVR